LCRRLVVNPANLAMFVAVFFSVIPAMVLLYFMLGRFEGFFDEKRLFKYLVIGLVAGAVIVLLQLLILRFHEPGRLLAHPIHVGLPILAIGYPLIEAASKVAVMNYHTIAGRRDAPFYGTSFGLGFGAILTFITVGRGIREFLLFPPPGVTHLEIGIFFTLLFLLFLGGIMLHAVTGTVIGKFTGDSDPLRALGWGTVLGAPFYLGYYFLYTTPPTQLGGAMTLGIPFAMLFIGIVAVRFAVFRILDKVVPDEIAKEVRRDLRRKRRGAAP
jgi:hypothetical protein